VKIYTSPVLLLGKHGTSSKEHSRVVSRDEHELRFGYKSCGFAVFWRIWIGFGFHNFWL